MTDDRRRLAENGLLTVQEAAQFLRLGRTSTYELISRGKLPVVRFGRAVRVPKAAVVQLITDSLSSLAGE